MRTRRLGSNKIEIISRPKPGFGEKAYQCENRIGCYESIGRLFTDSFAQVEHPECLHRGGRYCRYTVSWQKIPWIFFQQVRNWISIAGILSLIILIPVITVDFWLGAAFFWSALIGSIAYLSERVRAQYYVSTLKAQSELASDNINAMDARFNNAMMVQEIGQATATLKTEIELVEVASEIMKDRSEYDRALIMLADSEGQYLSYAAGFGYDDASRHQLMKTSFHLNRPDSKGIFVQAFREKQPILVQNMDEIVHGFSERSRNLAKALAGKSIICVPIAYEEQALGIIAIDNSCSERPLTQSDVSLLMGVAWQLAVGIINTRAFKQIKESEKKYRDVVESASSIIIRIDSGGGIVFSNRFAQRLFGLSQKELYGRNIGTVLEPEGVKPWDWRATLNRIIANGNPIPQVEETVYRLADGRQIWIAWTFQPIFSDKGILKEVLCIGNDVSQLMQTQEEKADLEMQLLRAQKMEALGTLAGGVAHDLNNVLAGLINYPELMLMQMPSDSPWRRYVEGIKKSGEKAAAIVQDLLTLARRNVVNKDVVNLNTIVTEYIESPEYERLRQHHPGANIVTRLEKDLQDIQGAPIHLSKALMNLVTNAIEALDGRPGQVVITTEKRRLTRDLVGYESVPSGDYVVLSVSDTGCGIAGTDLHRIFEPFFTKKQMGRSGTGLGMAVVWGAIKDHDGRIDIHSAPGRGTCFEIYFLPTTRKSVEMPQLSVQAYRGQGEKILVVDDVPIQCEIAEEILSGLGYEVASVSSGEAAVDYVRAHPVDLMVIDMIMGAGIDGLETYRRIIGHRPGQRAIITSGYSENEKVHQAIALGAGAYVKKPYTMEGLGEAVRKELDRAKNL